MPGWNADLTVGAYDHVFKASSGGEGGGGLGGAGGSNRGRKNYKGPPVQVRRELCEQWIEHPVLMQQRDTFANFFHDR